MSSLIVEVCQIDKVLPHPGADNLELIIIKGWQCVVPKGHYKNLDKCVYIPVDSVLPIELSDRLNITKYLSNGRVRCARLRGESSFGVVLDCDKDWSVGTSVTDHYGITKWEPPLRITSSDTIQEHPTFIRYTEIENLRNFPTIFGEGEKIYITEKIHGTNVRLSYIDNGKMAGSHRMQRKEVDDITANPYWFPWSIKGVEEFLTESPNTILFGETFGPKIQNLTYGLKRLSFAAFDIWKKGHYLNYQEFLTICYHYGIPTVPLLGYTTFSLEIIKRLSKGNTMLGADHVREGIVIRPDTERNDPKVGRVILKYINDDYLFKKDTTDNQEL